MRSMVLIRIGKDKAERMTETVRNGDGSFSYQYKFCGGKAMPFVRMTPYWDLVILKKGEYAVQYREERGNRSNG